MYKLILSKQPEVLRLHSIDSSFRRQLLQYVVSALESLTSLKLLPNGFANRHVEWLKLLSDSIFNYLTWIMVQKTLGQEYTYLNMINSDDYEFEGVPVQPRRRLLLFILSTLIPFLLRKTLKKAYMEMQTECKSLKNRNWWQEIVNRLPQYDDLTDKIQKVVMMLYLLKSDFCSLPQRILKIRYVYLKHVKQTTLQYRREGYIMLMQLVFELTVNIYGLVRAIRNKKTVVEQPQTITDQNDSRTCEICSDVLKEASATPCGHLYCWECIIKWCQMKPECPSCRTECQPNRVVHLRNY